MPLIEFGDGSLGTTPDGDHGDDSTHPDHDPQDGEPGAQLVGGEAFKCFEYSLSDIHNASSTTPSRMRMIR